MKNKFTFRALYGFELQNCTKHDKQIIDNVTQSRNILASLFYKVLPVFLFFLITKVNAQINFTTGLKAFYPMNNDYYNAQGSPTYHQNFYNATFGTDASSVALNAGQFNGAQRVNIFDNVINNDVVNFSIDFWFKTSQTSNGVFYQEGLINQQSVYIRLEPSNNRIFASAGPAGNFLNISTTSAFNDGNWHHYALTAASSTVLMAYVDGTLNATQTGSFSSTGTTNFSRIGCRDDLTQFFNGTLDNLKIWNTTLSAGQITGIYNAPKITLSPLSTNTFCPGNSGSISFSVSGGSGSFQSGNVFYAQLSDVNEEFEHPLTIGTNTGTGSGSISFTLPTPLATGSNYQIRILASQYPVLSLNTSSLSIYYPNAFTGYDILSGLEIHYPFDGNINDVSGNSITGTSYGTISYTTGFNGQSNSAISFNGTNTRIELGKQYPINTLDTEFSPFSVSFWLKQNATPASFGYVFSCWNGASVNGLWIGTNSLGNISFRINSNSFATTSIPNNEWVHFVCVYNGSNVRIYKNGVLANTVSTSGSINIGANAVFGRDPLSAQAYLDGSMDEFRFYKRALTATEIKTLYDGPSLASSNGPLCSGNLFLYGPTYAGLLYNWSGPNAFNSAIQNPTITAFNPFTHAGTYSLNLSLNGCTGTIQRSLVNSTVAPVSSISTGTFCSGKTASVTASGALTGQQYMWYNNAAGTNTVATNTSTYTLTAVVTSTYYVSIYDGSTCYSSLTPVVITVNTTPTISATSGTLCSGQSFSIVPGGANTYTFNGGGPIVSPTSNTSYSVTGTAANGCVSGFPAVSTITVFSLPTLTISGNFTVCNGSSTTLNVSGANTYTWSNTSNSQSISVSPSVTTTYSVSGKNLNGCLAPVSKTVVVYGIPTITAASGTICSGKSFTLNPLGAGTYTFFGGGPVVSPTISSTYSISGTSTAGCLSTGIATVSVLVNNLPVITVNSGSVCIGQSFTLNPGNAVTYTYTGGNQIVTPTVNTSYSVSGTNAQGCISSLPAISNVTVNYLPTISITGNLILCSGNSTTLNAGGANTYTWSTNSNATSISITPSANTTYSVMGADNNGCKSFAIKTVTVNPLPTITINSGSICTGSSYTLVPNGASSYTFINGGPVVSPIATTNYSITGTSGNGCSNSALATIIVYPKPLITISSSNTLLCQGEFATLNANGAVTYTWSSNNSGVSNVISPTITTAYSVTGANLNGCINTTSYTQSVSLCAGLSNVENSVAHIHVFPNPFSDKVTIVSNQLNIHLTIYSCTGALICTKLLEAEQAELDLSFLNKGIYFIRIGSEMKKIIKF